MSIQLGASEPMPSATPVLPPLPGLESASSAEDSRLSARSTSTAMGRSPPQAASKSAAKSGKAQPLALAKNVLPLVLLKPQSKYEADPLPPAEEVLSNTPKPVDVSATANTAMTDSAQPAFVAELAALRTQNAALSEQVGGPCVAADRCVPSQNCRARRTLFFARCAC